MVKLSIAVQNKAGEQLALSEGKGRAQLAYGGEYQEGDCLVLRCSEKNVFLMLRFDDAMGENFVFQTEQELVYTIPFGEKRISYSPKAFYGDTHVLTVREATEAEISMHKNLAKNVYDLHGVRGCYPHVHANVETRGESVFAARNAIDGCCCNESHGCWPFASWGINMQDDAEITLEFGREVAIDRMVLVTRADFPHDNYWKQVTFHFSDGSDLTVDMEKSVAPHDIPLAETKTVSWIKLGNLIKDPEEPSPFPALSQWEVYGKEAN